MKALCHWITVLLVTAVCFQDGNAFVKFKPPKVYPDQEEIVVTPDATIQLRCEGNRPLNWSIPKYTMAMDVDELAHISINFSRNIDAEYSFISHLEVSHSYHLDTGYYYCHYQEITDMDAVGDVDKVYVYVNDTENLLVQNATYGFVMQTQYEPAIIPCKPTSPDINVTMSKGGEMVPCTDDFVTYDPKKGFEFNSVSINDGGLYECMGIRGYAVESITFHLKVLSQTDKVAKPKIDEKSIRHVVLGNNVRLECTVQIDIGIVFNMDWKTPTESGLLNGRVIKGNATSSEITHNTVEYRIGSLDLIIQNVTHDDEGYYECIVQDHSHNKNSDRRFLQVFEPNTTYINFTVQGREEILVTAGEHRAQWVVNVAAHPPPELIWYDPKGKEISMTSTKYEVTSEPTFTRLKISDIVVQDAGIYQLKGINNGVEATVNLTLIVHDEIAFKDLVYLAYAKNFSGEVEERFVGFYDVLKHKTYRGIVSVLLGVLTTWKIYRKNSLTNLRWEYSNGREDLL